MNGPIEKSKGTAMMVASAGMYSVVACLVKVLPHVDRFFMAFTRFAFGLLIIGLALATRRVKLRCTNKALLIVRGLIGSSSIYLIYEAIIRLGVAKGTVMIFSYPVFATALGALFLREKIRFVDLLSLGIAMIGLYLLIIRFDQGLAGFFRIGTGEIIGVSAALLCGFTVMIIRKLHQTDGSWEITFFQCLMGGLILLVPASFRCADVKMPDIGILALMGLFATIGQLTMSQGYRYLPIRIASLLSMCQLIFNFAAGILIFHETITMPTLAGSLLIGAACILVLNIREKT